MDESDDWIPSHQVCICPGCSYLIAMPVATPPCFCSVECPHCRVYKLSEFKVAPPEYVQRVLYAGYMH